MKVYYKEKDRKKAVFWSKVVYILGKLRLPTKYLRFKFLYPAVERMIDDQVNGQFEEFLNSFADFSSQDGETNFFSKNEEYQSYYNNTIS
jgi:hypothetical protein